MPDTITALEDIIVGIDVMVKFFGHSCIYKLCIFDIFLGLDNANFLLYNTAMTTKIFVNGVFDLLHPGHVAIIAHAGSLGDHVMVAIDADERVRQHKGSTRPIWNQDQRAFMLKSLRWVDEVLIFHSDQELDHIIRTYAPDIMVKGSDYQQRYIIGQQHCKKIVFFERIEDYSTTKTILDIGNR